MEGATTRDRIVAAALAGFARRGVEATSLDDVALAVGVRKQTVLYWFRSKDALVSGVVEAAVDELGVALDTAVAGRRPGQDVVTAVVDEVLRLGARRPDLLVLVREVARLGPTATAALGEAIAPRLEGAAVALAGSSADADVERARRRLLEAGARVVATAVEAELRTQMQVPPTRAWLRTRRTDLLHALSPDPTVPLLRRLVHRGLASGAADAAAPLVQRQLSAQAARSQHEGAGISGPSVPRTGGGDA